MKAGGGAQKDVDQATSDQQTAEGALKAARDAVRIFGKTDAEIDQIMAERKVDSDPDRHKPDVRQVIARNAAPGFRASPAMLRAPFTVADLSTMWMFANVRNRAPAYGSGKRSR